MSDDTAKKLEDLAGLVQEADGGQAAGQAEADAARDAEAAAQAEAREWGMVAFAIGGALSVFAPELRKVYTEAACIAWGASMVPVAAKYGWGGPGQVPELGALLATASLAIPTVQVIKARLAELEAERKRQATDPASVTDVAFTDRPTPGDGGAP